MIERNEKHSGGFREKLPLILKVFKGDKVVWVLFFLLTMVEVCSLPVIIEKVSREFWLAALKVSTILALSVVVTILMVNVHYRYFKVIVPVAVVEGIMLSDGIIIRELSLVVLIESVLSISIFIRTTILTQIWMSRSSMSISMDVSSR